MHCRHKRISLCIYFDGMHGHLSCILLCKTKASLGARNVLKNMRVKICIKGVQYA